MDPMVSSKTNRVSSRDSDNACDRVASRHEQAQDEFARLLAAVGVRGFHGTATIAVSLQDGHIQNLRVSTERMVR